MKKVFLHLGYHKTATSFLQYSIFPELRHVNFVAKEQISKELRRVRLKRLSDIDITTIRETINCYDTNLPMLISSEALSASPFSPKKTKRQIKILEDLRRIFPSSDYDVKIIVGIREQVELFTSLYIQHIHQGGIMSAKDYIDYCEHNGSLQNFHFHRYLRNIEQTFGKGCFHLMIYEDFKKNASEEMLKLLNYMGEPDIPTYQVKGSNKSLGKRQAMIARRLNRWFKTPINPKGAFPIIELPVIGPITPRRLLQNKLSFALHNERYEFPEDLQMTLKKRYAEGNVKLADRYNLKLPETYFMR